jgi:hypothetical protein
VDKEDDDDRKLPARRSNSDEDEDSSSETEFDVDSSDDDVEHTAARRWSLMMTLNTLMSMRTAAWRILL